MLECRSIYITNRTCNWGEVNTSKVGKTLQIPQVCAYVSSRGRYTCRVDFWLFLLQDQGQYKAIVLVLTNQDLSDQSDMHNMITVICILQAAYVRVMYHDWCSGLQCTSPQREVSSRKPCVFYVRLVLRCP